MLLEEEAAAQANASGNEDVEMEIPSKEVEEEVAEELGLHLVWEDPNVNKRANCNGRDAETALLCGKIVDVVVGMKKYICFLVKQKFESCGVVSGASNLDWKCVPNIHLVNVF